MKKIWNIFRYLSRITISDITEEAGLSCVLETQEGLACLIAIAYSILFSRQNDLRGRNTSPVILHVFPPYCEEMGGYGQKQPWNSSAEVMACLNLY